MTNKVGNLTTLADSRSPEDGQLNLGERGLLPLDLADSADTAGAAHLSCHQSHSCSVSSSAHPLYFYMTAIQSSTPASVSLHWVRIEMCTLHNYHRQFIP